MKYRNKHRVVLQTFVAMKLILSLVISYLAVIRPNYQYKLYQKIEPCTNEMVSSEGIDNCVGYPAGSDILCAEDSSTMIQNEYFTIKVTKSALQATGIYKILDESKAGTRTTGTRNRRTTTTARYLTDKKKLALLQNIAPAYGQFYIATLGNGDKVIILLDPNVLALLEGESITLPIGQMDFDVSNNYFSEFATTYNVPQENTEWFIDMAGDNFVTRTEYTHFQTNRYFVALGALLLCYGILTLLFIKLYSTK